MKLIKEIREYHRECGISVRGKYLDWVEVTYTTGKNEMSMPHTVATYQYRNGHWEKEE